MGVKPKGRRKAMQDREIIEKLEDLIKEAIKGVIEQLALEERRLSP
ncbi:hypothetical protein TDIS_1589 [Thermosulfurimonas dismutans]|uniref:Uncharacterized protein n=1 Tax=Thermosulfurimonas dismutans TaxID=999894 RepID=A0A179D2U0_9BACT|nr:hypothetical protein TDIS_1589 [Thermosulfurimonas dismutans]